jgi:excisionase family DNA binding protein
MEAGAHLQPSGQQGDGHKSLRQKQEAGSEVPAPRPDTLRTLRIRVSRAAPPAPPGGRLWHGFAVLRLPLRRAGRGLTFGRLEGLGMKPMQSLLALDIGGMERKPDPSFFTERTLADFLAVSDRTIRNWIRRGDLPSYKFGAARRIDPADVKRFLDRHRDEPA